MEGRWWDGAFFMALHTCPVGGCGAAASALLPPLCALERGSALAASHMVCPVPRTMHVPSISPRYWVGSLGV